MRISTVAFALLSLAGFSYAAPPSSSTLIPRQGNGSCIGYVEIRFLATGTGPDDPNPPEFDEQFPTDGSIHSICELPQFRPFVEAPRLCK